MCYVNFDFWNKLASINFDLNGSGLSKHRLIIVLQTERAVVYLWFKEWSTPSVDPPSIPVAKETDRSFISRRTPTFCIRFSSDLHPTYQRGKGTRARCGLPPSWAGLAVTHLIRLKLMSNLLASTRRPLAQRAPTSSGGLPLAGWACGLPKYEDYIRVLKNESVLISLNYIVWFLVPKPNPSMHPPDVPSSCEDGTHTLMVSYILPGLGLLRFLVPKPN